VRQRHLLSVSPPFPVTFSLLCPCSPLLRMDAVPAKSLRLVAQATRSLRLSIPALYLLFSLLRQKATPLFSARRGRHACGKCAHSLAFPWPLDSPRLHHFFGASSPRAQIAHRAARAARPPLDRSPPPLLPLVSKLVTFSTMLFQLLISSQFASLRRSPRRRSDLPRPSPPATYSPFCAHLTDPQRPVFEAVLLSFLRQLFSFFD